MKKPTLAMVVLTILALAIPAEAQAAVCWTDDQGAKYSIELGTGTGSVIPVFGYRKLVSGSCAGIQPVSGTAIVVSSTIGAIGWQVHFSDFTKNCVSFRESLTIDLRTGNMAGFFHNDSNITGTRNLTQSSCPSLILAADEATEVAPRGAPKDPASAK